MKDIYMRELTKLAMGLMERNIPFSFTAFMNGNKIDWGTCDAVLSRWQNKGLLEIMGDLVDTSLTGDTVERWLTADEILTRIDAKRGN